MQGELMIGAKDTRGCEALAALLVRGPALQQLNLRNEGRLSFCHTFFHLSACPLWYRVDTMGHLGSRPPACGRAPARHAIRPDDCPYRRAPGRRRRRTCELRCHVHEPGRRTSCDFGLACYYFDELYRRNEQCAVSHVFLTFANWCTARWDSMRSRRALRRPEHRPEHRLRPPLRHLRIHDRPGRLPRLLRWRRGALPGPDTPRRTEAEGP